jgi:hypothetical protein
MTGTAIAASVLQRAAATLNAGGQPAAEFEWWRQRIVTSVPQAEPGWWVAERLATLIVYGHEGQRLHASVAEGILRDFGEQLRAGRTGKRKPIENPQQYFQTVCGSRITWGSCKIDWNALGRHRQRE